MAHFAQLDDNNKVLKVIVVNNNELLNNGIESEQKGIDFCKSLFGQDTKWKQTSYNTKNGVYYIPNSKIPDPDQSKEFRKNYAGIDYLIDSLDQANKVAGKYGMKLNDDIMNQLIFVNELDRMFGAAAQTSLKGQVAEAMQTGVDIARGNVASRAFDLLAEKAENLRGVNKENAVKSMEELLKRKAGQP